MYLNYDSSSRVIPATYLEFGESTWVKEDGDLAIPGTTYVVPVPTAEGKPIVELVSATREWDGDLLLGDTKVTLGVIQGKQSTAWIPDKITSQTVQDGEIIKTATMVAEDTTYHLSTIRFWKVMVEPQLIPDYLVVMHCHWQVYDINGHPLTWHLYYSLKQ